MSSERPDLPLAIEFRDVSIEFDGLPVLQSISFQLEQGDMLCVTGDSRAGKSVLLRLAIGFCSRTGEKFLLMEKVWPNCQRSNSCHFAGN